jgi:replicative DNA helicase
MKNEREQRKKSRDSISSTDLSVLLIPTNDGIEKDLISILVSDSSVMESVYPELMPSDFQVDDAAEVYTLMRELYNKGKRWNLSTLYSQNLSDSAKELLYHIPEGPTHTYKKEIVNSVKNQGVGRKIFKELYELMSDNAKTTDRSLVISKALQIFAKLSQRTLSDEESKTDSLQRHKTLMVSRYGGGQVGVPTGMKELDKLLGQGMRRSNLIIIGARPSVGKTSLSLSMAYNAAKTGKKVMFVSIEMSMEEIMDKLVAFETGLPVNALVRGKAAKDQVSNAYKRLLKVPLTIKDVPDATTGSIYAMAVKEKAKSGLDLVVVDYLGKLKDPSEKGDNDVRRIGRLTDGLKMIARMLNVVVLSPHQLSRRIEQRSKESQDSPMLSDLRDSGNVEQDADVVMFLTRRNLLSPEAQLHISKHRTGSTGVVDLRFDSDTTKFSSL